MDVPDLFPGGAEPFAIGFLGTLHQTTIGDEILHPRKAGDVLDLIQNHQGENRTDARDRLEPGIRLAIVRFGTAGEIEFDFAQQLVLVINERHIHFDRLADTRIGEMLFDSLPVGFVRQFLADLGQIVLTIGILNVG